MDLKTRKKYYNMCDPYKIVSLDSKTVIDIDAYKIDGKEVEVRGKKWAESIAKDIAWSEEPKAIYFTGYPGSGKTTELKRVEAILEDKEYSNLLPVYINAQEYLPTHESLDEIDVFSTIVYTTIVKVAEHFGDANPFKDENYFSRLWTWLNETDVTLKNAELGKDSSKIVLEMKENPKLRNKVKTNIRAFPSQFKNDVIVELDRLNTLVKTKEVNGEVKSGIVVIFDSLEHNIGIGDDAKNVADSIHRLFANRENLLLPIDVIYTLPPHLSTRQIGQIDFLPVIRVINKDNTPCQKGIEVMKSLVYERIPKKDLTIILGEDESSLEQIILYSGGYPRDLLRLLQQIIVIDLYPVSEENIERVFQELENEYRDNIPFEHKETLKEIYKTKSLDFDRHIHLEVAQTLFNIHVILRYRNGDQWFSLNPPTIRALGLTNGT